MRTGVSEALVGQAELLLFVTLIIADCFITKFVIHNCKTPQPGSCSVFWESDKPGFFVGNGTANLSDFCDVASLVM